MNQRNHLVTRRDFLKGTLVGAGSLAAFGMFGCSAHTGATQTASDSSSKEAWTFTDQTNNEVTVNIPVDRMVVMQHHSLDMLCQLDARDKVVGIEDKWKSDLGDYMTTVFPGIENLPTPGGLTDWNVEQIAALKPDVVIAASQADPDAMEQVRNLGIPVVVVSLRGEGKQDEAQSPRLANADAAYTEGCEWAIETLGKLTGKDTTASNIWQFCLDSRSVVDNAIGTMNDADRKRVFIACPDSKTYGNDKYVGCQLLRAGAINVAANDIQGYKAYTTEKLATWDPEYIIVQDRFPEVYTSITTDAAYSELSAVKNGKVILAPYWTKPWGNPDTDSIGLGELWLSHTFYPDKVSAAEVQQHAEDFYQNFYGVTFDGTVA
ncbi:MAG: ABC transporter substrate-binding protein [Eggerthellaceae bacterium]|jgi:iron complex transport system substrate-binding protein|nr:ABC transporter substrate-binding protein [Eggerthellaceae bacterium]